jgi:predicted CopG family antitoxin
MATKTISLELDAYERLRRAKREGESFSGVVRRARFGPADSRGSSILAALGEMTVKDSDREAVRHWEKSGLAERTASPSAWEGGVS